MHNVALKMQWHEALGKKPPHAPCNKLIDIRRIIIEHALYCAFRSTLQNNAADLHYTG